MAAAQLDGLSPLAVLGRGYAIARNEEGAVVKHVAAAPVGSRVGISVSDGVLACRVEAHATASQQIDSRRMHDMEPVQNEKPIEQLTFREAMAELDGIVGTLESNTLELEDSLAKYERGVALLRALQGRLSDAQQKVDVLMGQLEPEVSDEQRDTTLS
ncbi:MAG: exodeoxyribonuclease VII small subunit [Senegalimassilia faecalis]